MSTPAEHPVTPGRLYGRYRDERSEEGVRRGLAPEDQSGGGLGASDAGLCLFLISPGGAPEAAAAAGSPAESPVRGADVAQLVERWVKRVGLGGDSRRGVARLDIGGGRYSGAELVVVAEARHVSVQLNLNGADADVGLTERLRAGLEAKGYAVDIEVG